MVEKSGGRSRSYVEVAASGRLSKNLHFAWRSKESSPKDLENVSRVNDSLIDESVQLEINSVVSPTKS